MKMEDLLGRLEFEKIQVGTYWFGGDPAVKAALRSVKTVYLLDRDRSRKTSAEDLATTMGTAKDWTVDEEEVYQAEGLRDVQAFVTSMNRASEETLHDHVMDDMTYLKIPHTFEDEVEKTKPNEIKILEQLISLDYKSQGIDVDVVVTRVRGLQTTRKWEVKDVSYLVDGGLSRVWVFKADPDETAKELAIYHIAYEQGIPTGRPIGFDPKNSMKEYPYDVAILGGIVAHAGDPYDNLIANMVERPDMVYETALAVARLLADCHVKLTCARNNGEFEKYGIEIENASPRREIKERLLAALGIEGGCADGLIKVCEELYNEQSGMSVVSHGDIHTGNLVTLLTKMDPITYKRIPSIKEFGVIDWGSLMLDRHFGDPTDFWLHHFRKASSVCGKYDYGFEGLAQAYKQQFESNGKRHGLEFKVVSQERDALIQSVLWNIYEMYDPVRDDPDDIREKALIHCKLLWSDLKQLEYYGYREQTNTIKDELRVLLENQSYLLPIFNS